MRHPFFNLTHLVLREGESDFSAQHQAQGVVATLGPRTEIFTRPGATVSRYPGAKTLPRQSPHAIPQRSRIESERSAFMRIVFGGGDVKLSKIVTLGNQREILLTAGDGAVAEKLDLAELCREGAPALQFLQPAYLCSSARVAFKSRLSDASTVSWARAPFVYRAEKPTDLTRPAILCLSGRTLVWTERLEPGESRDFALGSVIAATVNLTARLRPTSQCHPDDYKAEIYESNAESELPETPSNAPRRSFLLPARVRDLASTMKTLLELGARPRGIRPVRDDESFRTSGVRLHPAQPQRFLRRNRDDRARNPFVRRLLPLLACDLRVVTKPPPLTRTSRLN